jgi:hypothetical protein
MSKFNEEMSVVSDSVLESQIKKRKLFFINQSNSDPRKSMFLTKQQLEIPEKYKTKKSSHCPICKEEFGKKEVLECEVYPCENERFCQDCIGKCHSCNSQNVCFCCIRECDTCCFTYCLDCIDDHVLENHKRD